MQVIDQKVQVIDKKEKTQGENFIRKRFVAHLKKTISFVAYISK